MQLEQIKAMTSRLPPSGSEEPPVRNVLVTYDEFKERRQLRLRVTAAFEKHEASPQV